MDSVSCVHVRPLSRCSICLPKAQWPKEFGPCRCKRLVFKGTICQPCHRLEVESFLPGGFLDRSVVTFYKVQGMIG